MTVAMRRELCAVMEYKVIEKAGSVLYNDGEVIDSWSAILNGSLEVVYPDGRNEEVHDRCEVMLCEVYLYDQTQTCVLPSGRLEKQHPELPYFV